MSQILRVPISKVRPNTVALRELKREDANYKSLVDSINQYGFLSPISVTEQKDPESGETYYQIIDGLHRYSACCDNNLTEIDVSVHDMDELQILRAQLISNVVHVDTQPVECARQMRRLFLRDPSLTVAQMAQQLCRSEAWVNQRLNLIKITNQDIANLVNRGDIKVAAAYSLAKLPEDEQTQWVERAMTTEPTKFAMDVGNRLKEIRSANRQGRDPAKVEFTPTAHMYKLREVKEELERLNANDPKSYGRTLVAKEGVKTPLEGFILAIKWVLHLDSDSIAVAKAAWEKSRADKEAEKERRKADAEKAKQAKAVEAEVAVEASV